MSIRVEFECGTCRWNNLKQSALDGVCDWCGSYQDSDMCRLFHLWDRSFEAIQREWVNKKMTPEMRDFFNRKKEEFQLEFLL